MKNIYNNIEDCGANKICAHYPLLTSKAELHAKKIMLCI